MPTFDLERASGFSHIIGIDEAGCGPWAGPVVVAAVMFSKNTWDIIESTLPLNDSKKLTARKREAFFPEICRLGFFGIGEASVDEIDALNIVEAVRLATKRALTQLQDKANINPDLAPKFAPEFALVDGIRNPKIHIPTQMVIKGDQKSSTIAAASILAKVTRDRIMGELALDHPHYGWHSNAGYGTKAHQEALHSHGVTIHHRKSYAPIRAQLEKR